MIKLLLPLTRMKHVKKIFFVGIFIITSNIALGQFNFENAFSNLSFSDPIYLTHAGDNTNRIFVVEQEGIIKVFPNTQSASTAKVFLDITDIVSSGGEMGLLGLAFHPEYETNGYFYVNYTANNPRKTIIARYQVTNNPDSADKNSQFQILDFNQPEGNHNGGWIGFGPIDGYLYIATGDGGGSGDPDNYGQSINTLLGKILCIDIDGGTPYVIPTTNPFYDSTGSVRREIFAWGLRNPWRCSFDSETGWFFAGDVGQFSWEEIDLIENGKNYGWRCYEGTHTFNTSGCNYPQYINPIWEYGHSPECSITGGYVYRGASVPELEGKYIYGDYCSRKIWALSYDGITPTTNELLFTSSGLLTSFGIDQNMEIYWASTNGNIYKFSPTVACNDISLNPGWNLVSVPLLINDMSPSNIFDNANSEVFGYSNGYTVVDTLVNGLGYWVKYDSSQLIQVCGAEINTITNVNTGWNIIGPFDEPVPIQNISSNPPNIITSSFFGYEQGYITTDTLQVGKGYWIKTNADGTIQIN